MILRKVYECENGVFALGGDILSIEHWHKPGTPQMLREFNEAVYREHRRRRNAPVVNCSILEMAASTLFKLSDEERKLIDERTKFAEPFTHGGIIVVASSGFAASFMRSFISGLLRVRSHKHPTKVVDSVKEGAAFLADQCTLVGTTKVTSADVLACVASARPSSWPQVEPG